MLCLVFLNRWDCIFLLGVRFAILRRGRWYGSWYGRWWCLIVIWLGRLLIRAGLKRIIGIVSFSGVMSLLVFVQATTFIYWIAQKLIQLIFKKLLLFLVHFFNELSGVGGIALRINDERILLFVCIVVLITNWLFLGAFIIGVHYLHLMRSLFYLLFAHLRVTLLLINIFI